MATFGSSFEITKARYVKTNNGTYYLVASICCAMAVLKEVSNYTTAETLKEIIELVQKDEGNHGNGYGQTNILVFTRESETILEKNLKSAGFKMICDTVTRRKCYEPENMKMWIYSF